MRSADDVHKEAKKRGWLAKLGDDAVALSDDVILFVDDESDARVVQWKADIQGEAGAVFDADDLRAVANLLDWANEKEDK